jgi:uncharacterized protein YrrD
MEFKANADVLTASGEKIGEVERVVIDPQSKKVTHVVVRKGFLFSEDKVVPVNMIAAATGSDVALRKSAGDLEMLPEYVDKHYVIVDERELGRQQTTDFPSSAYWYPPFAGGAASAPSRPTAAEKPALVEQEEYNIPKGTVALQEGAEVIARDDEHVGDVEQVLTDPQADRVTHFVIADGLLLKERKLVPYRWVERVFSDQVHLAVGSSCLEQLPEYQD